MNSSIGLIENGYKEEVPDISAALIDIEVCDEATCPKCGNIGMHYKPFVKRDESGKIISYRAFSVCPNCNYENEF